MWAAAHSKRLIFIARIQTLRIGHQFIIDQALELAENAIVLVSSATTARSPNNT
jgi:nicotinamide mononucleotide adenylyltransferase